MRGDREQKLQLIDRYTQEAAELEKTLQAEQDKLAGQDAAAHTATAIPLPKEIPPPGNPVRNRSIREIVLRKSPPLEKSGPEIRPAGSNHPPESSKPGTVHPENNPPEKSGSGSRSAAGITPSGLSGRKVVQSGQAFSLRITRPKTPGPENRMPGTP